MGPLTDKVYLYADDTLLYHLVCLEEALRFIDEFGSFSGVRINWDKSILFPLSQAAPTLSTQTSLKCTTKFHYLGIEVQRDLMLYLVDNVYPSATPVPIPNYFFLERWTS